MKHTPILKKTHTLRAVDTAIGLGILTLAIEVTGMLWSGPVFQASIYNPLPQETIQNRFSDQHTVTGSKAPSFTACERRASHIKNTRRHNQILTLCHAREKA